MVDLLRAASGDLRTEIVRVAFSILSQSILSEPVPSKPSPFATTRISWIRVSDKEGTQACQLCCKLTTGRFHGNSNTFSR